MTLITARDEINSVSVRQPHVVLLGAGASRAAFPHGDRHGRRLPVMTDFVEILKLESTLDGAGIAWRGRNFEDIYDEVWRKDELAEIETAVHGYFSSLELPDHPTIYDELILSLRPKDVIATFNWDPFLIQAARRNRHVSEPPRLVFLHGNVLLGYCQTDNMFGTRNTGCAECGSLLQDVPILYPIGEKNYAEHPAIRSAWEFVAGAFKNAFMVTIFGYGAPASDQSAVSLLKEAWGEVDKRHLEQFEVLDIRSEADLRETWEGFIHTHHYEVHTSFKDSWIRNHPRRTGEAYHNQYIKAAFIEQNPVPNFDTLAELQGWFAPLLAIEDGHNGGH